MATGDPEDVADIPSTCDGTDVGVGVTSELAPSTCDVGVGVEVLVVEVELELEPEVGVGAFEPPEEDVGVTLVSTESCWLGHGLRLTVFPLPLFVIVVEVDVLPVPIIVLPPVFPDALFPPVF